MLSPNVSTTDPAGLSARSNELLTTVAKVLMAPLLERELAEPKLAKLYDLTGKDLAVTALAKRLGMSSKTISVAWQRWERLGIVVKDGKRYRKVV